MDPKVTVLMPVYNSEKYLKEAIESILSQSFTDFEFLIVCDPSTDNTVEVLNSFNDNRLRLIINEQHIGQPESYNMGIKLARGDYIAIMHSDDISLPHRLEKQFEFMENKPDIGICGTWVNLIEGDIKTAWHTPTEPDLTKCTLLFSPSVHHPSVIMRKSFLIDNNLFYRAEFKTAEDYDFWVRASMCFPLSNLDEVLLLYRRHPGQLSIRKAEDENKNADSIRLFQLNLLDLNPTDDEALTHNRIARGERFKSKSDIVEVEAWLEKINEANENKKIYPRPALAEYLAKRWFGICYSASILGHWAFKTYYDSTLSDYYKIDFQRKAKFLTRCAVKKI